MQLELKRTTYRFVSNETRVITRFFNPGGKRRIKNTINRVLSVPEETCVRLMKKVTDNFSDRHQNFEELLLRHYDNIEPYIESDHYLSQNRRLLLGSYFTNEYSIESVALFNPSIVLHPSQKSLPDDSRRYIISFRAVGEGHISSIVFRSVVIDKNNIITIDGISPFVDTPSIELDPTYDRHTFILKLKEENIWNGIANEIFADLSDCFHFGDLQDTIQRILLHRKISHAAHGTIESIYWLARSNYEVFFSKQSAVSERVLFPVARNERNGIEDARFVKCMFENENSTKYYATYTAYNGRMVFPMLLETDDFLHFNMCTLNGTAVKGKGMALFPRKINGKYVMVSRQDGENLFIMQTDNIHFWHNKKRFESPHEPWEFVQIGNCGSPLETDKGWLLLTHGVGPMRTYCIGAELLDLDDPSKVLGKLKHPLIIPKENEREGYVPNVVYSCGAIVHHETLVIPYAVSDSESGIATINLNQLLKALLP
jgi:predicted GH43/DUF377 family glycosyl hydrolase